MIKNPPGYQNPTLLEMGDAYVKVNIRSLMSDVVVINDIKLDNVKMTIEQKGFGNNLQDVLKAISSEVAPKEKPAPSGKPFKKLHIDNLDLTNIEVRAKLLPIPGKSDTVTLKLAPIKMTNLGSDDKMDIAALSSKILSALASGVAKQGADMLPKDVVGSISEGVENLSGEVLQEGGKVVEKTAEIGKGVTEGLKGLFKPKQTEPQK